MIYILKLSGSAHQVFPLFSLIVKTQGNKTLGELAKEMK